MTTDTPPTDEVEASAESGGGAHSAVESGEASAEPSGEAAATAGPKLPFWQRPYVERYLAPFVLPLVVVLGVVMLVLNISRIFLSTHGNVDVLLGSVILLTILVGAAILSASPRMRSSSLALIAGGFILTLLMGGWLSVGSAEPEAEGGNSLPAEGPASGDLPFESSNALVFVPDAADSSTGVVKITLTNQGGEHTFHFEDPSTMFETLHVNATGDTTAGRAYFGAAGDYVFYCTIPGHREAGMEGTITVSGPSISLAEAEQQAEAAPAGETPTSAPGSGPPGQPNDTPGAPGPAEDPDR
jgi:plastocyanin